MLPKRYVVHKSLGMYKRLPKDFVFVFGSNQRGAHGAGAAAGAKRFFGAIYGRGFGPMGQSYAIPTKDVNIRTLDLKKIKMFVDKFLQYAKENPKKVFIVTALGTGLAGYDPVDIAPMFFECSLNVVLPFEWVSYLPEDSFFILSPMNSQLCNTNHLKAS